MAAAVRMQMSSDAGLDMLVGRVMWKSFHADDQLRCDCVCAVTVIDGRSRRRTKNCCQRARSHLKW